MTDYTDLYDAVESDPNRDPIEKETSITFTKPDDLATVHTAEASLMRRLLRHPAFDLDYYETSRAGDGTYRRVDAIEYAEEGHDGRKPVWTVGGTMPIGALRFGRNVRQTGGHAEIIANVIPGQEAGDDD